MSLRHYLQFSDLNREEYEYLFARTRWIKERFKSYQQYWPLVDRTLVMIFEKLAPVHACLSKPACNSWVERRFI